MNKHTPRNRQYSGARTGHAAKARRRNRVRDRIAAASRKGNRP